MGKHSEVKQKRSKKVGKRLANKVEYKIEKNEGKRGKRIGDRTKNINENVTGTRTRNSTKKKDKTKLKQKSKKSKAIICILIILIILIIALAWIFQDKIKEILFKENITSQTDNGKEENVVQKDELVIKSTLDYNRVVTFKFENNIVSSINIYEQYEDKDQFTEQKKQIESIKNDGNININEDELSIEYQKNDLGEDTNKSYDEIYDKYLNQLIGMYEIIS